MTANSLDVTAVVVGSRDSPYLAETLTGLGQQHRSPQRILIGLLTDDRPALHAELDAAGLGHERSDGVAPGGVEVVGIGAVDEPGTAMAALLAQHPAPDEGWLWVLHDDSAPNPDALAELAAAAERSDSVGIVGAKQVEWDEPDQLISVGISPTVDGQRVTFIEDAEIDQGQHDGREDVYAVGSAGMLIQSGLWSELGGPDPTLGVFGDGADLSRRARLAGHRVLVAPAARVRHARASYRGLRADPAVEPDPRRSFRARRSAQLHSWLVSAPTLAVAFVALLALLLAPVRAAWRLARTEPELATDELLAALVAVMRPGAVFRARRRAAATRRIAPGRLAPLRASWREAWQQRRNRRLQAAAERRAAKAPSELEIAERAAVATKRRIVFGAVLTAVSVLALVTVAPSVVTGPLIGGALLPSDATFAELWRAALSPWIASADGHPGPADPFMSVLGVLAAFTGGPFGTPLSVTIAVVLVAAIPLAAIGGWFAAGAASRSIVIRGWAAAVWACGPALLVALTDGRLGAIVAHLALPFIALGIARALGVDRRDVVLSGMIGAQRLPHTPRRRPHASRATRRAALAAVARSSSRDVVAAPIVTDEDLHTQTPLAGDPPADAAGGEPADGVVSPDGEQQPDRDTDGEDGSASAPAPLESGDADEPESAEPDAAKPEDAAGPDDAAEPDAEPDDDDEPEERATVVSRRSGVGSLGAAAAAGLAFAIAAAGAPVLLPAGLLALIVLAVALGRGRSVAAGRGRLLIVAVPAIALLTPIWLSALRGTDDGGWRVALADPGAPWAAEAGPAWLTALGWPAVPVGFDADAPSSWLIPAALGLVLLIAALTALLRGSGRAGAVRIGWLIAVIGLVTALVSSRTVVALGRTGAEASGADHLVTGWAGPGTSLLLLGLLIATVSAVGGLREALAGTTFGWRQVGVTAIALAAVLAVVGTAAAWSNDVVTDRRAQGELIAYTDRGADPVPALGLSVQTAEQGARVLALTTTPDGIDAQLWRGNGPQLTETSTLVSIAELSRTGTDDADSALRRLIAELATGATADAAPDLAEHAVAVVIVPPADSGATGVTSTDEAARDRLIAQLDATFGLERVTENPSGVIWRVSSTESVGRALLLDGAGQVLTTIATDGASAGASIDAAGEGRTVVLAERASSAWRAELDGRSLRAATSGWNQVFTIPDGAAGDLTVQYQPRWHGPWQLLTLVVFVLTALLALPTRRRKVEVVQ